MHTRLHILPFAARSAAMVLALAFALCTSTGSAALKDRTKPTTPGNFRVTAKTAYTVTVEWSPSSDNSGSFNYYLSGAYGVTPAVLPKTATSHTFTALFPGNEYWFFIYAKDAAGNVSGQANLGPIRLPSDTTPPWTAPIVSINEVGSTDDFDAPSNIRYDIYVNGVWQDVLFGSGGPSIVYADFGQNLIEVTATDTAGNTSAPASVTVVF